MRSTFYTGVLIFLSCSSASLLRGNERNLVSRFGAQWKGDSVQLVFAPVRWPKDWQGFHVGRRQLNSNDEWTVITQRPICPNPIEYSKWSECGLTGKELEKFQDWVRENRKQDKFNFAYQDGEYFKKVRETKKAEQLLPTVYQEAWGTGNYWFYLAYGMGYVDDGVPQGSDYEYGLFPVFSGRRKDVPVKQTVLRSDQQVLQIDYELVKLELSGGKQKKVSIEWEIDAADCRSLGFDVCRVYRAKIKESVVSFVPIRYVPGFESQSRPGKVTFFCFDRQVAKPANNMGTQVYKIVPVTYFKEELPVSWRVEYRPGEDEKK